MAYTGLVQIWPQIVHLYESDRLTLEEATRRVATLDPLHVGMQEWYLYKMRSLLRAFFLKAEVMTLPVEILHSDGRCSQYVYGDSRAFGVTLLLSVQLG